MPFLGHLEAFRKHLLRIMLAVGVGMVLVFSFLKEVMNDVLLGPMRASFPTNRFICSFDPQLCIDNMKLSLQWIAPMEQFTRAIVVGLVGGLVLAFPYAAWELWRFLRPALKPAEQRHLQGVVLAISLLFLTGVLFAYFVVTPFALSFFANFNLTEGAENNWRVGTVMGLVIQLSLAGGFLFQLPVAAWVLAQVGFLSSRLMRTYRRHAYVVIVILAAILTPTPDAFTQLVLSVPLVVLYEASIFIAMGIERRKKARGEWVEPEPEPPLDLPHAD